MKPFINEELTIAMEPDHVVDKYAVCVKKSNVIVGHLPLGKDRRFVKMIFYFLGVDRYAECKIIITGKKVNLGDEEGMQVPCLLNKDFWNKKYVTNTLKLIDIESSIDLFFQSINQQPDALNSVTPNAFENSKTYSFIMIPSKGVFWLLFSTDQSYIALSTFS